MKLFFRIAGLFLLLSVTLAQDLGFDLADALDDDKPPKATAPPKKNNDMGFDLSDAFGDDEPPTPKPPVVVPPKSGGGGGGGGGGGTLKDSDLFDVNQGGYEPDGGRVQDPGHDQIDPADQPQDAEVDWSRLLKTLIANVPEDVFMWLNGLRQSLAPLLEKVLDLIYALPQDDKQEL